MWPMAMAVIGTIISPTPLPKPLLVTPIRNTARSATDHQKYNENIGRMIAEGRHGLK